MVDFRATHPGDAVPPERESNGSPSVRKRGDVIDEQWTGHVVRQEKPVPAPADVSPHAAETIHIDGDRLEKAMALDVFEGRIVLVAQFDANDANRRFETVRAEADAAEMRERHGGADRGVTAHPEIAGVVEEDEARGAGRVDRLAEKRADGRVIPPRLENREAPDIIELLGEAPAPPGQRAAAQRRAAFDDEPRWLAFGMGIDDTHDASAFRAAPFGVPSLEEPQLRFGEALLAVTQGVGFVEMQRVFGIAPQHHQVLEIEHEVGSFVESRQRGERADELESQPPRLGVALRGALAEGDKVQGFLGQHVAYARDRAHCPAIDEAVEYLGIDADQ